MNRVFPFNAIVFQLFFLKFSRHTAVKVWHCFSQYNIEAAFLEGMNILNVAEKNDAAKSLADIMSGGRYRKREGISKFNKIYEFPYKLLNQNCSMIMTSVSGHLLNFEFQGQYKKWRGCNPVDLFDAPVVKYCPDDYLDIKRTLEREVRSCQTLIVWTDCDREGENIAFEVIQVCLSVKPSLNVYRARFSEITPMAVTRAVNNLVMPDEKTSFAVDVRSELDLRIGAAFTRFQTLRLQKVFPNVLADQLVSYGSCQFPTLGFVVERYKQVQAFVAEPFWKLRVTACTEDMNENVEFVWNRQRLFDYLACLVIYQHCLEKPDASVVSVSSKPKSKWRPVALDTVELEKSASRKLHINAKETMRVAEHLYNLGYISYPRTETNSFPKDFDLPSLIQQQTQDPAWGAFAANLLNVGATPRNGNKSDQAHPPIHPTKYANNLHGNEKTIYEFIVRHFLACCSQDAQGQETIVEIDVNNERFTVSGLMITARNYLDVYPFDKWSAKSIPVFQVGDVFMPKSIEMSQGETSPPSLLTEADLIALMEKHGIGTDATHAEHIETIKSRLYVGVRPDGKFIPGELGMGLVEGYDAMGYEMSKPYLRANLESDLKRICDGEKDRNVVLAEQIARYKAVFIQACQQASKIDDALAQYFGDAQSDAAPDSSVDTSSVLRPCPKCGQGMTIKKKKDNIGLYISCMGFPDCRSALWLPPSVVSASVHDSICDVCQPGPVHKVKFIFKKGSVPPYIPLEYVGCIGGCEPSLNEILNLNRNLSASNTGGDGGQTPVYQCGDDARLMTVKKEGQTPVCQYVDDARLMTVKKEGQTPVCQCGDDARLMTVKKEGPNTGRQFYSCPRPADSRCSFFLWANSLEDVTNGTGNSFSSAGTSHNSISSIRSSSSEHLCKCGTNAKLLTVTKDGQNKGRYFYACQKPKDQGCGYFAWADDNSNGQISGGFQSHNSVGGNNSRSDRWSSNSTGWIDNNVADGTTHSRSIHSSGRGKTNKQMQSVDRPQPADGRSKSRRKCGVCGEEGHTRKTCPENR